MTQLPHFDPYELLGVDASADAAMVDRAYKARIRYVHPDVAGAAGLDETKRLNIAREWLLDPELRAQLPPPVTGWRARMRRSPSTGPEPPSGPQPPSGPESPWGPQGPGATEPPPAQERPTRPSSSTEWFWEGAPHPPPRAAWDYDPAEDDPLAFDYGVRTDDLRAFFGTIRSLTSDERARATYSLGDEPPLLFDQFEDQFSEVLWARSLALEDAISLVWAERVDESRPLLFPRGRVFGNGAAVANAYAQWILLGSLLRQRTQDPAVLAALEARCSAPWEASVGHARYGPAQDQVITFLDDARLMSLSAAERLARSWERHMGDFLYGRPGEDWFPGAPERPNPPLVSARLAAVDASRIEPPEGLPYELRNGFRCGLRLTGYVLALGGTAGLGRDFLRPWRDATDEHPSFFDRARWGMPRG